MTEQSRKVLKKEIADFYGLKNRAGELVEEGQALSTAAMRFYRMLEKPTISRSEKVHLTGVLMRNLAKTCVLIDEILYLLGHDEDELLLRMADQEYVVSNERVGVLKKVREENE